MADRQTALAVFDFLDSLRAGQYRIGADAEKDHATAGLLASLSGDTGLRDAVCAKLISPGMERARFLMVAEHDPRALPLFASGQVKPWYQADYNVREIANSEFHQDIPALLWRLSNTIPDSARREGMLEAAAYMSFMQGDPEAAFTGHLGRLAAVSPEGEVTALPHGRARTRPASRMGHGTAAAARTAGRRRRRHDRHRTGPPEPPPAPLPEPMNTSGTDPWEIGPIIAAGTAVAIDTAREPEPERRPPAEPEPEPGPGLEPDARCVDDAGSEDRANPAVDPWEIGPLPSASNPVGNDIPADAPASEPQHVGGAVEPADLADTIDLTPVGDRDAAMPVREWRRIATTAGGILLAACVTVAGMSAWRSHESATAARELEQATADCATAHAAAKKAERKLVEYLDGDRLAQAKAVTADKLADPETLETLDKLAEQYSEGERIPACAATDTETANATTSKLQAIEKKHTGNLSRLKKAAGAVFSSRLAHTVEQGERLYSSSEGKVQDEYSRALLRASIDKRDEKAITDAMDKVNASIDAKTKADEERKAQEEAAAAAAAQAQSTPAPQQYSYTPSGSASGSGSGPTGGGYHSSGGSAGSTGGSASPGWSVPANPDPSQLPGTDPSL